MDKADDIFFKTSTYTEESHCYGSSTSNVSEFSYNVYQYRTNIRHWSYLAV